MTLVQLCYVMMVAIAWVWAGSQAGYAMRCPRYWPIPWRVTSAVWLATKAVFLTYVGIHIWDTMSDHAAIVLVFASVHLVAFIHCLTLPHSETPPLSPPPPRHRSSS